jgi:anion-transporting  ArsA/GET3 family ATPase
MMLDMKRTFDDVVAAHATPERAEQIFANPFYQSLSSSFAGTQEYMAMEKLSQLRAMMQTEAAAPWDLIVVDTPPSRSALDFLDAPNRLGRFLDGRMIRLITAPARVSGKAYLKVVTASFTLFTRILTKILGSDLLTDVASFVASLETMFGGFRERAEQTYQLLKADGTAFLVVAAPEPDALREASFFVDRLAAEEMPLAGLVLNRMHRVADGLSARAAGAAVERLDSEIGQPGSPAEPDPALALARAALRVHAELATAAESDARLARRFAAAHAGVPTVPVPALSDDVHDLTGLRAIGKFLANPAN